MGKATILHTGMGLSLGVFRIKNDYYDETSTDERPFTLSSTEPFVPCEYEDISESELQGLTPSNHFLDST